jgi:hypothetical protein
LFVLRNISRRSCCLFTFIFIAYSGTLRPNSILNLVPGFFHCFHRHILNLRQIVTDTVIKLLDISGLLPKTKHHLSAHATAQVYCYSL